MKLTAKQHKFYDVFISSLAVAAVILIIIDLSDGLKPWQHFIDFCILGVFIFDYLLRFIAAPEKLQFVSANICDLIAILPFHTIFRSFKLFGATPGVLMLSKLPRLFAFMYRPLRKAKLFFNTNGFKYVFLVTSLLILIGGVLIHFAEDMSLADGIWWAFVTATTVGYGDISPHTFYGRIIAMVLMVVGIGLLGTVTSTITSYFLKNNKKSVQSDTLERIKGQLDNFADLSVEDVETICCILKALKKQDFRRDKK